VATGGAVSEGLGLESQRIPVSEGLGGISGDLIAQQQQQRWREGIILLVVGLVVGLDLVLRCSIDDDLSITTCR